MSASGRVMRTSQALRAHRVITTDDDNSDSITTTDTAAVKRTTLTNPSPGEGPHHDAIVTTTAGANPQSLGIWKLATTGGRHGNARRGGPGDPKYNHVMKREDQS